MESCQNMGHQDRQELERQLKLPRNIVTLMDYKMKINLGPGKVKKTSVRELEEEYEQTEEGQLLLNGGSLTIPVVDFVKDKFKLKSVETRERMRGDLMHIHDKLIDAGLRSEDVINLAKKDKKSLEKAGKEMRELYSEQQALSAEAFEEKETETLKRWGLPGLKMKPVLDNDNWKKCEDLVEQYLKYTIPEIEKREGRGGGEGGS